MRLICGLVCLDGDRADSAMLRTMVLALISPGLHPQVTQQIEGESAFAVLDFAGSAETPVLPLGTDGTWLAGDIRLDHPAELASTLGLERDARPEAIMLAAQARWAEDLPDKVNGDFALATWSPDRKRLLCARDIMGVRPLCYSYQPGRLFAFASLPRGLHSSGVIPRKLDITGLGQKFVRPGARSTHTGFEKIEWLGAGQSLVLTPEGLQLHRAWNPDPAHVGKWRGTRSEAAAKLRALVEEAVVCRLPPAGPVAIHLSGGLDSSAITVIAARRLRAEGRALYAYSQLATPINGQAVRDEREYIDAVLAQEPDIFWSPVYMPPFDAQGVIDDDLSVPGALLAPDDEICAAATAVGASLLLSGAGGDEAATYNATGIYAALLRQGFWNMLWRELPLRARRDGRSVLRATLSLIVYPYLPRWFTAMSRRLRGRSAVSDNQEKHLSFLTPIFAALLASDRESKPDTSNTPQDRIAMLTESYLVGRANNWSILGARHGLAFSFPLKDRRIIDFILSLPLQYFLDKGYSRQPFRNAMAGILPETIRWRNTKFSPFPDAPLKLAAAREALLLQLAGLRACHAVEALFNWEAIADALRHAPDQEKALQEALAHNDGGTSSAPLERGLAAQRALGLAAYIARMNGVSCEVS